LKKIALGSTILIAIGIVLFGIVQMIIILNGAYNRNPNIENELLAALDSIALTLAWTLVAGGVLAWAILQWRGKSKTS
jgi:hypothetical protein